MKSDNEHAEKGGIAGTALCTLVPLNQLYNITKQYTIIHAKKGHIVRMREEEAL